MKKLLLMVAFALGCISASAQQTLTLSTYKGTDLSKYDGQTMNVSVSRYLFTGWNTISLPFAMSEEQVNEVFGSDCKLEKLVGVENDGMDVKLNFQDCKKEGIKANTPYILYYTGENGSKQFTAENVLIINGISSVVFTAEGTGETVTMAGAQQQTEPQGLYGILAKANSEASFVNVDATTNGFYATRCYVQMSNGNFTQLKTNHIAAGEVTSITSVAKAGEKVEVYNLSGVKVADSIDGLQPGIYVINGKTVVVK
jgi:effector-binding domain-containing protein